MESPSINTFLAATVAEILLGEGYWYESYQLSETILDVIGREYVERIDWEVISGLKRKASDVGLKELVNYKKPRTMKRIFIVNPDGTTDWKYSTIKHFDEYNFS